MKQAAFSALGRSSKHKFKGQIRAKCLPHFTEVFIFQHRLVKDSDFTYCYVPSRPQKVSSNYKHVHVIMCLFLKVLPMTN